MRTANKRKLNRLIRKCFEKGNVVAARVLVVAAPEF